MRENGSLSSLEDALGEAGIRIPLVRRALDRAEADGASLELAGLVELLYVMWVEQNALIKAMGAPYRGGGR